MKEKKYILGKLDQLKEDSKMYHTNLGKVDTWHDKNYWKNKISELEEEKVMLNSILKKINL